MSRWPDGPLPIEHGTYSGYVKHLNRGVPVCDPCRVAVRAYRRAYKDGVRAPKPGSALIAHGTYSGFQQHKRRGVPVCDACNDACAAYQKAYQKPYRERTRPKPIEHGTHLGYAMHKRRNVRMCEPCREAARKYRHEHYVEWRAEQKAREQKRIQYEVLQRALHRLRLAHPAEFQRLLFQETAKSADRKAAAS